MRTINIFVTTLFICAVFSYEILSAQDTTITNADTLQSSTDTSQAADSPLSKFKKAFQQLTKTNGPKDQDTLNNTVEDPQLDLMGFVLDATRTPFGRTFYELFYRYWSPPENASFYTIKITERPTPGRGSQIIIKMNYEQVLSFRLQPKRRYIKKVSKQATTYVKNKLKKQSVKGKLLF